MLRGVVQCVFCSGKDDLYTVNTCILCGQHYHSYCTQPPTPRPSRNWTCHTCKHHNTNNNNDKPNKKKHNEHNNDNKAKKKKKRTEIIDNKNASSSSQHHNEHKKPKGKPFTCIRSMPFRGKEIPPPGSPRRTGPISSNAENPASNTPQLPAMPPLTPLSPTDSVDIDSAAAKSSRAVRAENRRFQTELQMQDWTPGNLFQFNHLVPRQKKLHLGKSGIHSLGAYALEPIKANDFVIEYIGELVRPSIAEIREKQYDKIDVGGSYLFRIDDELVIDATFKGNLARFINHSCEPNCFTRVITVGQTKRVVIYAKRDIQVGEELSYDYKFPIEDEHLKVPCTCGKPRCRKFLN